MLIHTFYGHHVLRIFDREKSKRPLSVLEFSFIEILKKHFIIGWKNKIIKSLKRKK